MALRSELEGAETAWNLGTNANGSETRTMQLKSKSAALLLTKAQVLRDVLQNENAHEVSGRPLRKSVRTLCSAHFRSLHVPRCMYTVNPLTLSHKTSHGSSFPVPCKFCF